MNYIAYISPQEDAFDIMIANIIFYGARSVFICADVIEIVAALVASFYSWKYGHIFWDKLTHQWQTLKYVKTHWSALIKQDMAPLTQTVEASLMSLGLFILDAFIIASCIIVFYFTAMGILSSLGRLIDFIGAEALKRTPQHVTATTSSPQN